MHRHTHSIRAHTVTHPHTDRGGDWVSVWVSSTKWARLTRLASTGLVLNDALWDNLREICALNMLKGLRNLHPEGSQILTLTSCLFQQQLPQTPIEETCLFSPIPQNACQTGNKYENFNSVSRVFPLCSSPTTDNQCKSNPSFYLKLSWL